ncbi:MULTISPECIES: Fic family protein [unclassified Pantoea]|uniref:Fic family protein n=1 Tax=unclassified Pantoea TaxID=2630326 RepID=UPI001CD26F5D|nr:MULTISPECIES: Fic family protein [unclassified Pantoea]MCA1175010.1 Fic family protein [Pantoea sp. alder69]MCA1249972.1 Fic family protein [Pantoea sp. alder70]MCA1264073.1 Fic family protein [Pantoea sp. alder81]
MRLRRPPQQLLETQTSIENAEWLSRYSEWDARYLHFDELSRRIRDSDERLAVWSALKFKRRSTAQHFVIASQEVSCNFTAKINAAISLVDRMTFARNGQPTDEDAASYLMSQLIMEEAISSSQLEGAATTSRVAMELLAVGREPRNEDESMIMGNWRLMQHIAAMGEGPLTRADILHMHHIACAGINDEKYRPGEVRCNNDVFVAGRDGEIIHQPPDHTLLNGMLDALCAEVEFLEQQGTHPLLVACVLHFAMGYIHPFNDGNGRTARGLFYHHLIRRGYHAFRYISISKLLKAAAVKYGMSYLYSETDELDLTYFVQFQCEIVMRAVNAFTDQITTLRQERSRLVHWVEENMTLAKGELDIMAIALHAPGSLLSAAGVKSRLGVADNTARSRLKNLADQGLLRPIKEGKGTVYQAPVSLWKLKEWLKKR